MTNRIKNFTGGRNGGRWTPVVVFVDLATDCSLKDRLRASVGVVEVRRLPHDEHVLRDIRRSGLVWNTGIFNTESRDKNFLTMSTIVNMLLSWCTSSSFRDDTKFEQSDRLEIQAVVTTRKSQKCKVTFLFSHKTYWSVKRHQKLQIIFLNCDTLTETSGALIKSNFAFANFQPAWQCITVRHDSADVTVISIVTTGFLKKHQLLLNWNISSFGSKNPLLDRNWKTHYARKHIEYRSFSSHFQSKVYTSISKIELQLTEVDLSAVFLISTALLIIDSSDDLASNTLPT